MIRFSVLSLGISLALPTAAWAQGNLPTATQIRTPAGIEVLHAAIPGAERTVIHMLWKDTKSTAEPGSTWLHVMAPPIFADGPVGETRSAYSERLKDIDVGYNWSVGLHGLNLTFNAKRDSLHEGAEALAPMIATPQFSEQRFAEVRGRALQTWRQNLTSTEQQANTIATRLQAANAPMTRIRTFDEDTLQAGDLAALKAWREQVVTRGNLVVAAAGPSPVEDVTRAVDRMLGLLPAGIVDASARPVAALAPLPRSVHLNRPAAQTVVMLTAPVQVEPGLDVLQMTMALRVLSGGFDSRLYRAVREGLGAAYGIRAEFMFLSRRERVLLVRAPVDHQRARAAQEAMTAEYERFWRDGVTEAEFAGAKEASRLFVSELARNPGQVASQLVQLQAEGMGIDAMLGIPQAFQKVTLQEFNTFIRRKLPPPPLGLVVVGPAETAPKADCVIAALAELQGCAR